MEYNSLKEYRRIARSHEKAMRLANISFTHHQVVATRDDRQDCLARAETDGWSQTAIAKELGVPQERERAR